jgi:hypothetical protein
MISDFLWKWMAVVFFYYSWLSSSSHLNIFIILIEHYKYSACSVLLVSPSFVILLYTKVANLYCFLYSFRIVQLLVLCYRWEWWQMQVWRATWIQHCCSQLMETLLLLVRVPVPFLYKAVLLPGIRTGLCNSLCLYCKSVYEAHHSREVSV